MRDTKFTRIALIIFSVAAVTVFGIQAFAIPPLTSPIPGSVITDTLVVGNTGYSFAIADTNYLKGGHMQVSNRAALLNSGNDKTVTLERRSLGMLVTVLDDDGVTAGNQTITYRLVTEPGTALTSISDWKVALPDSIEGYNGGTNKYLTVDDTGNFIWGTPSGGGGSGSPAGLNTEIQFNNNGSFGSNSGLTWTTGDAGIPASLEPDVSFTKLDDETISSSPIDVISPSVHLARGATQGLYNAVTESSYDKTNNTSPAGTEWNSDGWGDLSDVAVRSYVNFYTALSGSVGNNIIGSELVMHDIAADKYYKFSFTSWGSSGTNGGFSYTRNLINLSPYSLDSDITFTKSNSIYPTDVVSPTVQLTRGIDKGLYNPLNELSYDDNNYTSPTGTEWNSDGWGDFSNVTARNYVSFYEALGQSIGNNIIGSELVMHDIGSDKYYKFSFLSWTQGSGGGGGPAGGFSYTRNLINNSTSTNNKLTSSANFLIGGLNRYLNFGSISGSSGYGFKDNNGIISYKNNGGAWASFDDKFNTKQDTLISGVNISTINGASLLSGGDIIIRSGSSSPITIVDGSSLISTGIVGSGNGISSISGSIFLGPNSGSNAMQAHYSNFLGFKSGYYATNASYSNFIGYMSGSGADNSSSSNFIGFGSGLNAKNAPNSNFIGNNAGGVSANASNSNFIGNNAGYFSPNASNSIFIGQKAGDQDIVNNTTNVNDWSILLGYNTKTGGFKNSILLGGGGNSGQPISNTKTDQFMLAPSVVNLRLRGIDYVLPDYQGGVNTVLTNDGTGILTWAAGGGGSSPIEVVNGSNLFSTGLTETGSGVTGVAASNFFGNYAGQSATNASNSNFLGNASGGLATNASNSNFFGDYAGYNAIYASNSNFFGYSSGNSATNASSSNFLGQLAGNSATNATNSIFIGQRAGFLDTVDNTSNGLSSILLGSFTNTGGFSNSIVLGSGISGSPISNTKANQFMLTPTVTEMRLRGVDYSLPASQGGVNTVLTNNGSGVLTWAAGGTGGGSSPIEIVNVSNLFSTGLTGSGSGVTTISNSNFLGSYSGYSATNASSSNFLGSYSGYQATYAYESNFLGSSSGFASTNAINSNFFGSYAGAFATNASNSNFFGYQAGSAASNASNSIFIGKNSGLNDNVNNTTDTDDWSILLGYNTNTGGFKNSILLGGSDSVLAISNTKANQFMLAPTVTEMRLRGVDYSLPSSQGGVGDVLTNNGSGILTWAAGGTGGGSSPIEVVNVSNLFSTGLIGTGSGVTTAINSNFFGRYAGNLATNASDSNFFGESAGDGATDAYESNFFGNASGGLATDASNSNFFGTNSGYNATSAYESNFLGSSAGYAASLASYSNFLGSNSGYQATNASGSNFLGLNSGYNATGAYDSNFLGSSAGNTASLAYRSNFLGFFAGNIATNAYESNFLGYYAGNSATNASDSNFLGFSSGQSAFDAYDSNFLGYKSGYFASGASNSNFIGSTSGESATNAYESNFLGASSGFQAANANNSNFLGSYSGNLAVNAANSNFIGNQSGNQAFNASNSIFIGQSAGLSDIVNNTTNVNDFSILIGKSTSTGGFKNSIALGGSATNTAVNQFMIGSTTRPINTTVWNGAGSVSCTFTTAVGAMNCTSDSSMKKNITDLNGNIFNKYGNSTNPYTEENTSIDISKLNTLDKILALTPVTYNWGYELDTDQSHIGFIAQDVKQIFPNLVSQDINTNKLSLNITGLTPYIVEAIQELNLKVTEVSNLDVDNNFRTDMIAWFSNTSNKIEEFVAGTVRAKNKLCIGEGSEEICITKEELIQMKNNTVTKVPAFVPVVPPTTPSETVVEDKPKVDPIVEAPVVKPIEEVNETPVVEKDKEVALPVIETTPIVAETLPVVKEITEVPLPVVTAPIVPVVSPVITPAVI